MKYMLLMVLLGTCLLNYAQVPQAMPYQAVARDTAGNPIINKNISLRFSIHDSIPGGPVVYKETQITTTNLLGLFNCNIGQGTAVSGVFADINWGKSFKYLQVELDTAGGSNFSNMGTEQMLSVPYAFYAGGSTDGWSLNGNEGTDSSNFIGTTDNVAFNIRVNNHRAGIIDPVKRIVTLGAYSGNSLTTAHDNVFIGDSAGFRCDAGGTNTFVGSKSGMNTYYTPGYGFGNSFFGANAGKANTFGTYNSFSGASAGLKNTTASYNSFFGGFAGAENTTGSSNSFFGGGSGMDNSLGSNNSFFGTGSGGANTTGEANSFFGKSSGYQNIDGTGNCFFGTYAGPSNKAGHSNCYLGNHSGSNNKVSNRNVAVGYYAMGNNTLFSNGDDPYDSDNVAIGFHALYGGNPTSIMENIKNVAIGAFAGDANTTGSNNTFLGWNTGTGSGATANNITCLGSGAVANISDAVRLGNTAVTVIEGQVAYSIASDGRFKSNVTEEVKGLDFILRLRPVVYNFDTKKYDEFLNAGDLEKLEGTDYGPSTAIRQSGFIAQEVEQAANEVGYDFNGVHIPVNEKDNYRIAYSQFTVPLVKAVQELNEKNETLAKENEQLKSLLNTLNARLSALELETAPMAPYTAKVK